MGIQIVRFTPEHMDAVREFSEATWDRPRTESFYRWRYLDCANFHFLMLALEESRCVAMISVFQKPYWMAGVRRTCYEVSDWYCLPGLKGKGIGGPVRKAIMDGSAPVFGYGGTEDNLVRRAHMGWTTVAEGRTYTRPLRADVFAATMERRLRLPRIAAQHLANPIGWLVARPRRLKDRMNGEWFPLPSVGEEISRLYTSAPEQDLLQIPDLAHLRWLTAGFPGIGHFIPLCFCQGDDVCGWALVRVFRGDLGLIAKLIEMYWEEGTAQDYRWMVSVATQLAHGMGAVWMSTVATAPIAQHALVANGFRAKQHQAFQLWTSEGEMKFHRPFLMNNYSDDPLRPYPHHDAGLAGREN